MSLAKKIIAPVDFSEISNNAVFYAAALASQLNMALELLHIVQFPVVYGEVPQVTGVEYDRLYDDAKGLLNVLDSRLKEEFPGLHIINNIKAGNAAEDLRKISLRPDTFAVVMATHGAGAVERFFLGSNTHSLIKNSGCPVFVIPADYKYEKLEQIALASDFKDVVRHTPEKDLLRFLQSLQAKLTILHCQKDEQEPDAENVEAGLLLSTMFDSSKPEFVFLRNEKVEECIINYCDEHKVDLLAVIPKEHNFFQQWIGHNHTENFIAKATLPVLVFGNN